MTSTFEDYLKAGLEKFNQDALAEHKEFLKTTEEIWKELALEKQAEWEARQGEEND